MNRFQRGDRVRVNLPTIIGRPNPWHGRVGRIHAVPGDPLLSDGKQYGVRNNYSVTFDGELYPTAPHREDGLEPERAGHH